jgi:hypothetical protein
MRIFGCLFLAILLVVIIISPAAYAENTNVTPVSTKFITIDPIGKYVIGDVLFINGTTNLPVSEKLKGTITTTIFIPAGKYEQYYPGAFLSDIPIAPTPTGPNRWSVNVTDLVINELPTWWSPYLVSICPSSGDTSAVCASQTLNVSAPANSFITIDPIGNHHIGEIFFINGTTNLPVSKQWIAYIVNQKMTPENYYATSDGFAFIFPTVSIESTTPGTKRWSVNVTDTAKNLVSGDYKVVAALNHVTGINAYFSLLPGINGTRGQNISLIQPTTQNAPSIQSTPSQTKLPSTTQTSLQPSTLPIAVIAAIAISRYFYERKSD